MPIVRGLSIKLGINAHAANTNAFPSLATSYGAYVEKTVVAVHPHLNASSAASFKMHVKSSATVRRG